jgi:hypothetical protein
MKIAKNLRNLFFRGFSPVWWGRKFLCLSLGLREYYERRNWISAHDPDDADIRNLNSEGFLLINFFSEEVTKVINYCLQLSLKIDPLDEPPGPSEGKDFWRLLVSGEEVLNHPSLLNFARLDRWKTLSSSYLGQEAVLSQVVLMKSYPTQKNLKHSQNWHLDADDSRNLVFYLYINDVRRHNGPFELIPKSNMKPFVRPRYFRKYAMLDKEMSKYVKIFSPKSLTGSSGTIFACDTCTTYHRGSRCESSVRLALAFRYQTFTGLYPFKAL